MSQQAAKFEECRDVHQFDLDFDFEEFKAAGHDLATIIKQMACMRDWETKLNQIKSNLNEGLVHVNSKKLREKLMKRVKDEQVNVRKYLNQLAEDKA